MAIARELVGQGRKERALLAQSGVRAVVERLVAAQPQAFWSERAMLVQLGDKLVLVRDGKVVHVLATAHSTLFPRVDALRPLAAQPNSGAWGGGRRAACSAVLSKWGLTGFSTGVEVWGLAAAISSPSLPTSHHSTCTSSWFHPPLL